VFVRVGRNGDNPQGQRKALGLATERLGMTDRGVVVVLWPFCVQLDFKVYEQSCKWKRIESS